MLPPEVKFTEIPVFQRKIYGPYKILCGQIDNFSIKFMTEEIINDTKCLIPVLKEAENGTFLFDLFFLKETSSLSNNNHSSLKKVAVRKEQHLDPITYKFNYRDRSIPYSTLYSTLKPETVQKLDSGSTWKHWATVDLYQFHIQRPILYGLNELTRTTMNYATVFFGQFKLQQTFLNS